MTRQRSDEHRKQQIRAAATRCFVRRGYAATRMLDIAREAGLSKGGVYFHYRAKEDLFHDILENLSKSLEARWTFDVSSELPADRSLGYLVKAHLRTMHDEPEGVLLQNLLVAMAVQDPVFRDKFEQLTRIMRGLYSGVIARGIAEGLFVAGDPDTLAISVLAYIHGLGSFAVLEVAARSPISPEAGAEQVLRMLKRHSSASAVEFAADLPNKTN